MADVLVIGGPTGAALVKTYAFEAFLERMARELGVQARRA
jgi:hypothetical protein